ncbi:MAG TPA: glycoside hydrolase family 127 protein [Armatimonadota bacterium]|nr:glycoside hydrolase family 127 protein [Armatimonadota bacterium]
MTGDASKMAVKGVEPAGKMVVQPFNYKGIVLEDGRLRRQFDEVREYYLRIPNDDLLYGYRKRTGLPAPGKELGGWYTGDAGNVFPQIISGFARMYAATGDPGCLEKANYLISEWAKCIAPDGYFFYSTHPTSRQYFYEKMVSALIDMYVYCDNKDTLGYLSRITDWAEKNLNCTRDYANACGDPKQEHHAWGEWYTVSESLYRAYLVTGDARYRDFAEVWEYKEYWDLFAKKADIFGVRENGQQTLVYHAYSHVNTFSSAAAAYLAKGELHYLDVLRNAYDYLQSNQVYATGGYGPNEELIPNDRFANSLVDAPNHCEAQCGSWAGFKMCKYLISFTGDAKYGDWIERMVYNLIGADLPMAADGRVFYYAHYHLKGAEKKLYPDGWACCTGTRPQAVADYHDLIYFKDSDSLYVNLYTPSKVEWGSVTVQQSTLFPEDDVARFTISSKQPAAFSINLRVSSWLAGEMTAKVNGEPVYLKTGNDHWAVINRVWKNGDELTVNLPMNLWLKPLTTSKRFPAVIMYGPVALAARSLDGYPAGKVDFDNLEKVLIPSPGEPLTFHLASDYNVLFRPFYAFMEGEQYFLYLDPD